MDQQNTLENQLNDELSRTSRIIAKAYVTQLFNWLQTLEKGIPEITEEEMLAVVQLENVFIGFGGTPRPKQKNNRRNTKTTKLEASKADDGDFPKTKDEGPPSIDRCGYVLRFGSKPGYYCNNKAEGKIFELDEGQRRFCDRCVKGKNVVKDIVEGKSNTLEILKGKSGNRRGKPKGNQQEIPPTNKPGDFSSAVPGDSSMQNLIPYMEIDEESGLFGIAGFDHIVIRDKEGRIGLVASKTTDGGLEQPSEESREWARDNLVTIIDKPELFIEDEEEEEEEVKEEVKEEEKEEEEEEEKEEEKEKEKEEEEEEEEEEIETPKTKMKSSFVSSRPKSKPIGDKSKSTPNTKKPSSSKISKSGNTLLDIPGQKKK